MIDNVRILPGAAHNGLSLLDCAVFASISAMSVFALFSPLIWIAT